MSKKYLFLILPFIVNAQDLKQLVDLSLENQLIQSSKQSVDSIKEQYKSVKSAYLPKVTIGATYSNTNEETATTPDNSIVSFANINYIVYDGGKRGSTYEILESNINSAKSNLNSLKNQITLSVINYYYSHQSLVAKKEATLKEIEQLNAQYNRLQKFLDAGTTTSDEVDKIKSRVENGYLTLHQTELDIQTVLHNLEYITSSSVDITGDSQLKQIEINEQNIRDDVQVLEYQMKSLLSDARSAKSSNYPTVSLDNNYNHYDMNYENKSFDSGLDEQNVFKVNVAWKIFDFGSTTKAYNSKYQEYKSAKSRYEYEKNKANIDLKLALKAYDIAKLKIKTSNAALKAANSTYDTIEAKYQNGLVDNVAYLEALSEKYNAISSVKSAKYDLEVKKANIIYHSGKNVWEYVQ